MSDRVPDVQEINALARAQPGAVVPAGIIYPPSQFGASPWTTQGSAYVSQET